MPKPKKERKKQRRRKERKKERKKRKTKQTNKQKTASVWKKLSLPRKRCWSSICVRFSDSIDLTAGVYVRAVFRQHPLNRICHRLNCWFSDNLDLIEYVTALIVSGYVCAVFTQQRHNRMCHRFVGIVFFPPWVKASIMTAGWKEEHVAVQGRIYAPGKTHMRSTTSLRSFPNVAFETVCSSDWRRPSLVLSNDDRLALPLSTPLSSRRSMVSCPWLCARRQCSISVACNNNSNKKATRKG